MKMAVDLMHTIIRIMERHMYSIIQEVDIMGKERIIKYLRGIVFLTRGSLLERRDLI